MNGYAVSCVETYKKLFWPIKSFRAMAAVVIQIKKSIPVEVPTTTTTTTTTSTTTESLSQNETEQVIFPRRDHFTQIWDFSTLPSFMLLWSKPFVLVSQMTNSIFSLFVWHHSCLFSVTSSDKNSPKTCEIIKKDLKLPKKYFDLLLGGNSTTY